MADNAGDVAGAALFSFVLVHWLNPFQVLLVVHLPLLAACLGWNRPFPVKAPPPSPWQWPPWWRGPL
jgi:hypothetical protein